MIRWSLSAALLAASPATGSYMQAPQSRSKLAREAATSLTRGGRVVAPIACRVVTDDEVEAMERTEQTTEVQTDSWLETALAVAQPNTADGLQEVRKNGAEALQGLRFPRRKEEPWRRTDLSWLASAKLVAPSSPPETIAALLAEYAGDDHAGMRLVVVDGVCDASLSDLSALPQGVTVGSGSSSSSSSSSAMLSAAAVTPEVDADDRTRLGCLPFAALNQASVGDVVVVDVPDGMAVEQPLQIVCLSTGPAADGAASEAPQELAVSHPHVVVRIGKGASLKLLQQYGGVGNYFTNAVTRFDLQENATLDHSYLQEQSLSAVHIDSFLVAVGTGGAFDQALLQSGARISRVNIKVDLNGPGADSKLRGLALATGNQLSDVHSTTLHASSDCTSSQEQRNAIAGRARVVFKGGIKVPRGADNTNAAQLCRSLLLSDNARVDVQPVLEIDTDEVECTHGATISDLDDEMVFYLQARGLSRLQARALLLEGWARSALETVPSEGARVRAADKARTLAPETERKVRRESLSSI